MTLTDRPAAGLADRVARICAEVFAPAVLIALLLFVVGWEAGDEPGVSRWWGLPAALFAAVLPMAYVFRLVRRGRLTDHHIPEREHRSRPLLVGGLSVLAGGGSLVALGAPPDIVALLAAGVTGLVVWVAVTAFWKMSIHAGVAAGTVTVLTVVYGPWAALGVVLLPLTGWARVRLSAHTPAQVIAGTIVGALIAGTVFPAVR